MFKDLFSQGSSRYAEFRPRYPGALFALLAARAPMQRLAWDCATGNGQAALGLADHFDSVVATDASPQQIAQATPHPRVTYRVAPAESSGLPDGAAGLVTVAQALHWLDRTAFFPEVLRVLAPGGVCAVWCYNLARIRPDIDRLVDDFYSNVVGPWWHPERALVEDGYRGIEFPFEELAMPALSIEKEMTLPALLGYVRTWSAVRGCQAERGIDPVIDLAVRLAPLWGPPQTVRPASWPLSIRAGFRPA